MKMKDRLAELAKKIENQRKSDPKIDEKQTQFMYINPFIEILGYNTAEQSDFTAEFPADFSTKKSHKVDYALKKGGIPIVIVECKRFNEKVVKHGYQLSNYFQHLPDVRFGVLTNGIIYHFYSDIDTKNTMDPEPFFEFNIEDFSDESLKVLEMFCKDKFEVSIVLEKAKRMTYTKDIMKVLYTELTKPSNDFIRYVAGKAYLEKKRGSITEKIRTLFDELVKDSLPVVINQLISNKMIKVKTNEEVDDSIFESKIITTEEEREAYFIVKSIVRRSISPERIGFKDAQAYFSVRVDDSSHKTICRLYLNSSKKYISIYDSNRQETKLEIKTIDDIFQYSEQLLTSVSIYAK